MKISGVDIRPGNIIEYEGAIWRAVKIQHTQPGKGGAYMQVELKNLIDGRKTNVRFRSAEVVERVRLDTKDYQFLYRDGDMLVFMDTDTYEQVSLPEDLLGDAAAFLQDGMQVKRGQVIARVGHTGDASAAGPHLHFAINSMAPGERWWDGTAINPYPLLAGKRAGG